MSQLDSVVDRFTRRLTNLDECCRRVEAQLSSGGLLIRDVELLYSSTFLTACSSWESLLEDVLYEAVCGAPSALKGNFRLATFKSRTHFRDVLRRPNKEYFSMTSVPEVVRTASLFINEGRPFSAITDPNRTLLQQAFWIRNAIAHQSDAALKTFRTKVPGATALPPHRRFPAPFLRVLFRTSPDQRRYEPYFAAMATAATEIRSAWI